MWTASLPFQPHPTHQHLLIHLLCKQIAAAQALLDDRVAIIPPKKQMLPFVMLRTSRSLLSTASRVSRMGPVTRAAPLFLAQNVPPAFRAALFSSKPPTSTESEDVNKNARETLKSNPSAVSTQSSVRHVFEEPQASKRDQDMSAELKHDIGVVKDTFKLSDVPRESHILGLAGTLPYFGTSLSTLFLSWDLNKEWPTGNWFYDSILIDHETARHWLGVIEPIQLGYGAVIISFLGAIHWGLEYAEKKPHPERTRFRYAIGLAAPAIAWPTMFMPIEYAMTAQFGAFVGLYFLDSRAAMRGWAPYWYGKYRFLLTAMVGLALLISLVGRAKIGQHQTLTYKGLAERIENTPGLSDHTTDWTKLEKEEKERRRKDKKEAEKKAQKEKQEKAQQEMKDEKSGSKQTSDDENKAKGDEDNGKGEKNQDNTQTDDDKSGDDDGEKEKEKEKGEAKDEQKDEKPKKDNADKDDGGQS